MWQKSIAGHTFSKKSVAYLPSKLREQLYIYRIILFLGKMRFVPFTALTKKNFFFRKMGLIFSLEQFYLQVLYLQQIFSISVFSFLKISFDLYVLQIKMFWTDSKKFHLKRFFSTLHRQIYMIVTGASGMEIWFLWNSKNSERGRGRHGVHSYTTCLEWSGTNPF